MSNHITIQPDELTWYYGKYISLHIATYLSYLKINILRPINH